MSSPLQFDFLIFGQGLAGSLLGWRLLRAGRRVMILDDGHRGSSSMVAAGLINPLAGIRFNPPPGVHAWLQSVETIYAELEQQFGRSYLHWVEMLRLFRSPEQVRFWQRQQQRPENTDLLDGCLTAQQLAGEVAAPHGGFVQRRTGYVELPALLADLRDWFVRRGALREANVDAAELQVQRESVHWRGISARTAVCCEGWRLRDNPWFNWLPLTPLKGEILRLDGPPELTGRIHNGAFWLIPLADGGYRFGATHEHGNLDLETSQHGLEQLARGFATMYPARPLRVAAQLAGIRPGTGDRMPLIGPHPQHPSLWVFNGFGARGALSIPWYVEHCADALLTGAAIPAAADIQRFSR